MPIVDHTARRRQRYRPEPILFGLHHVLAVLNYLCFEERAAEEQESNNQRQRAHSGAAGDIIRMEAHAELGSSRGRIMNSNSTPTAAVTAAESGDHNSNC